MRRWNLKTTLFIIVTALLGRVAHQMYLDGQQPPRPTRTQLHNKALRDCIAYHSGYQMTQQAIDETADYCARSTPP